MFATDGILLPRVSALIKEPTLNSTRKFKLTWREASSLNPHDDTVDSDQ